MKEVWKNSTRLALYRSGNATSTLFHKLRVPEGTQSAPSARRVSLGGLADVIPVLDDQGREWVVPEPRQGISTWSDLDIVLESSKGKPWMLPPESPIPTELMIIKDEEIPDHYLWAPATTMLLDDYFAALLVAGQAPPWRRVHRPPGYHNPNYGAGSPRPPTSHLTRQDAAIINLVCNSIDSAINRLQQEDVSDDEVLDLTEQVAILRQLLKRFPLPPPPTGRPFPPSPFSSAPSPTNTPLLGTLSKGSKGHTALRHALEEGAKILRARFEQLESMPGELQPDEENELCDYVNSPERVAISRLLKQLGSGYAL